MKMVTNNLGQVDLIDALSQRKENYLASAFLFVLVAFLFVKVLFDYYPMSDKDVVLHFSTRVSSAKYLSEGYLALWNKNTLSGIPYFNSEVLHNPLNLFSIAMVPMAPLFGYFNSYSILLFLCHFLMGFFTFHLCRRTLGIDFVPSLLAGAIYATNMGMKERVDIMTGTFVVLPLVIESVYQFTERTYLRKAVINGCLLAAGFYASSLVGVMWVLMPFSLMLIFRFLAEKKHGLVQAKRYMLFFLITLISFLFLSSGVFIPFLMSIFSDSEMAYVGTKTRFMLEGSFLNGPKLAYFIKKYILQQILPLSEPTGAALVRYKLPLIYKLFSTGFWNSYSILFLPSVLLLIVNYRRLERRYKILLNAFFALILFDLLLCITPFNNLCMTLTMQRGILNKMDFMLNLFGGLTVAIALDFILRARQQDFLKKWALRLTRGVCSVLLLFSGLTALVYFVYILSPDLVSKGYMLITNSKENIISLFRYNHKYLASSELTPWLSIYFISKAAALLLLLLFFKHVRLISARVILAGLLFFVSADRVAMLNLFASFNSHAKNTFSESLPLTRFFLDNIGPSDRILTTNVKDSKQSYYILKNEYGYPEKFKGGLVEYSALLVPRIKDYYTNGNPFRWTANSYWDINAINGRSMILPINTLPVLQDISGVGADVHDANIIFNVYTTESKFLDILGGRYVLSSFPIEDPRLKQVFRQVDDTICTYVYENVAAFPRAWVVTETMQVKDRALIYDMMERGEADLRKTALVMQPLPVKFDSENSHDDKAVKIITYEPNCVKIEVKTKGRALLVLSDTYFKGWRARVNGNPSEIHEVNGFMRGVVVEEGRSVVKFDYLPFDFIFFLSLNIIAIFIVTIYLYFPAISRRKTFRRIPRQLQPAESD